MKLHSTPHSPSDKTLPGFSHSRAQFEALVADRKGDVLMLEGKKELARAEYDKAYSAFEPRTEYRRLVEVKLNALGAEPTVPIAATVSKGKQ
mgnify:FL=1